MGWEAFSFGVRSTLSRANFDLYVHGFDDGAYPDWGPWFGWLSTDLSLFGPTANLAAHVCPQPERRRLLISLSDADHPLTIAQAEGIGAEQAMAIYAYYGHAPA